MLRVLSKWYLFFISIALTITSFCVIVFVKTTPNLEERISFVIGAFDADSAGLNRFLNEKKPSSVKEINYRFNALETSNFNYILVSLIRADSDFFILPFSYFDSNKDSSVKYAATIDENYVEEKVNQDFIYYSDGEYLKGIKIYDSTTNEGLFKDYITYTREENKSDYYLFFTFNSHNIGTLNDSKTENVFSFLKEIFAA